MTTRIYQPVKTVLWAAQIIGCPIPEPKACAHIVWEYTGYPEFFMEPLSFEKQLLEFMREWKVTGKWPRHPLDEEQVLQHMAAQAAEDEQ